MWVKEYYTNLYKYIFFIFAINNKNWYDRPLYCILTNLLISAMFECYMNEIIHESIYDYCDVIYENICYNNNNCHDNYNILQNDLYKFIENEIEKMSIYDINNILMSYGIDNAYKYYLETNTNALNDIKNSDSITKTLVNHLIVSSFEIK